MLVPQLFIMLVPQLLVILLGSGCQTMVRLINHIKNMTSSCVSFPAVCNLLAIAYTAEDEANV